MVRTNKLLYFKVDLRL